MPDGPSAAALQFDPQTSRFFDRFLGNRDWIWFGLVVAAFAGLVLSVSYLDEDAFISFRVVDNFVHGYGLRWNVDERVQVYTNPLWVLLLIPLHAASGNIATASYVLSLVASVSAFALLAQRLRKQPLVVLTFVLLPLGLSQAFTDYTSSGLENPLLYLFVALLLTSMLRLERSASAFQLSLWASLSAVARPDSILLFLPSVVWFASRNFNRRVWLQILLGALPLWIWLGFSLLYYGTPFPNPKYAKLGGDVSSDQYLRLGLSYLLDSLRNDPVTFAGLWGGSILGLAWFGPSCFAADTRVDVTPRSLLGRKACLLWLGCLMYGLYVIWIGGDFMAGRHFAAPFFLSVGAWALVIAETPPLHVDAWLRVGLFSCLVLRVTVQPMTEQRDVIFPREQGRFAVVRNGQIRLQRYNCGFYEALFGSRGPASEHSWSKNGSRERRKAKKRHSKTERHVVVDGAAGKAPFYAGPGVTYVDPLGIADSLLARLPDEDGKIEMAGHLKRHIPTGYLEARRTDSLAGMDPALAEYYAVLREITAGPLFSTSRWAKIWNMNMGRYDGLLVSYKKSAHH